MGEGWGDYFACTILGTNIVAAWVTGKSTGFRAYPYDSNFPDNFGNLGSGRYKVVYKYSERNVPVHAIGEIWCATLIEINKKIGEALGNEKRGKILGMQLVIDALKLSPTNPSFLNMRDSILRALDYKLRDRQLSSNEYDIVWRGIWEAFGKFGMGPAAQSNGAQLSGIVADFNVPQSRT
jgi:extracellular elastinolytic metalloproteinase